MHNMYRITFIFITSSIVVSSVEAVPLQRTLYETLIDYSNKCPYLKTTKLLKPNPSYLESCSAFSEIQNIPKITRESAYDVSCLLYANNFMLLCNNIIEFEKIINNTSIDKALKVFNNVTITCNILQNTSFIPVVKNGKNITTLLKNPRICSSICSEITSEEVTPICSLAAYSLSLVNAISKTDGNAVSKKDEITKPHDDSNIAPNKQAPPPPVPPAKAPVPKPQHLEGSIQKNNEISHKDVNQPDTKKETTIETNPEYRDDMTSDDTQPQSDPDTLPTDISTKKTGNAPSESTQQTHSDTQLTQQIQQETGTALENKQSNKNPGEHVENPNEKDTHQVSQVLHEEHGGKTEKQKEETDQKISAKIDAKKEDKKPDPIPPANNTPNEEIAPQEPQNEDDLDIDGDTNNLDGSEDMNLPDNNDELLSKDGAEIQNNKKAEKVKQTNTKPKETDEDVVGSIYNNPNTDEEDSFFFIYFMMVCAVFILGYIGYHNKQKVLALVIEGRRGRRGSRRGRPNSANYHKLDSNLEEAVTSSCNKNTTNIIY